MAKFKRIYGIKYPFTTDNEDGLFIDVDKTLDDKVASRMIHVILTPRGSRLRQPEFGTRLINYLFDPSDDMTWQSIKSEVTNSVAKYVKNVTLNNIEIVKSDENNNLMYMRLDYSVVNGNEKEDKMIAVRI